MSFLSDGIAWHESKRHEFMTEAVVYNHAGTEYELNATIGRSESEAIDADGVAFIFQVTDFMIRNQDIDFVPVVGDFIIYNSRKFELLPIGTEGVWRWSDSFNLTRRVHTKEVNNG